jgi:hypothetical protein
VVVDSPAGPGGIDLVVPGGAAWTTGNARWTYRDPSGTAGGVTKVVMQDRSARVPGLLRVVLRAKGGSLVLPDAASVRTTIVAGSAGECASITWNDASGPSPRCRGDAARLVCK